MTLTEHIDHMKRLSAALAKVDIPVQLAASSALAQMSERIFTRGESVSGGQFSYDSDSPLYANPLKTFGNTSGIKPPTGKTGKTVFASTGKKHKTTWLPSYQALRSAVGRESGFVNWVASGDLKSEVENRSVPPTPRKVGDGDYVVKVTSEENTGKLSGLIEKYPGVFEASPSEKKTFFTVFEKEVLRLIYQTK